MRAAPWLLSALALLACSGDGPAPGASASASALPPASAGPAPADAASPAPAGARTVDWVDPEPAGAQARAEAALALESNRDKTTRLVMHITTLVDRRTGLEGFRSEVAGRTRSLEERLDALGAEVSETEVVIRLPGSVLFDFDSDAVRPDAERTLTELAAVLEAHGGRPVRIEGHTDSIASDAYNLDLSRRRAESVQRWLADHGVDAGGLTPLGLGESRPVADNATAAGRQLNRRVEIVIER